MSTTNMEKRMRVIRWCLLGLLLVSTVGCSDEGQQSQDEQAEIEQAKTEFQKLCDKYARVYVAEEMPNFRGYLSDYPRSIEAAMGKGILRGVYDYYDVRVERPSHYVGTVVEESRRTYQIEGSGYFRVTVEDDGHEKCVAPMRLLIKLRKHDPDKMGVWTKSDGKCLAVRKIDKLDVEYVYSLSSRIVPDSKSAVLHRSVFSKGFDGEILVEVSDVRVKYVNSFGNVETKSCVGTSLDARGIAVEKREANHGS